MYFKASFSSGDFSIFWTEMEQERTKKIKDVFNKRSWQLNLKTYIRIHIRYRKQSYNIEK